MFLPPPLDEHQRAIFDRVAALARERFAGRAGYCDAAASFPTENYRVR